MKGWFKVPGVRPEGDRTLAEQIIGIADALAEARGKTVLDLGCAEGLISLEFAKAGASRVEGIESLDSHLEIARAVCAGYPITFTQAYLQDWIVKYPKPPKYDIVLALGIVHKMKVPGDLLAWACKSCSDLLLFRAPAKAWDGWIRSKYYNTRCHVPTVMTAEGFALEAYYPGVRGEGVEYWRRVR